jgi:hypothetical protein
VAQQEAASQQRGSSIVIEPNKIYQSSVMVNPTPVSDAADTLGAMQLSDTSNSFVLTDRQPFRFLDLAAGEC